LDRNQFPPYSFLHINIILFGDAMKFLVLIRWYEEHQTVLNKWKWAEEKGGEEAVWDLPEGVTLGESALLFGGPYNLVMFFSAEKEE
jgi:hypothetical protein